MSLTHSFLQVCRQSFNFFGRFAVGIDFYGPRDLHFKIEKIYPTVIGAIGYESEKIMLKEFCLRDLFNTYFFDDGILLHYDMYINHTRGQGQ